MSNYNILTDLDKRITQPKGVIKELMYHQKTMVQKMLEIEESRTIVPLKKNIKLGYEVPISDLKINTNFAILGDKVGAGKTLTVSALISIRKLLKEKETNFGISQYFTLNIKLDCENLKSNLIIVPHKLIPQWKDNFSTNISNLNVFSISANKDIDTLVKKVIINDKNIRNENLFFEREEVIPERINCYDVILIGDTMYKRFYKACQKFRWSRIIIDEADTIKLPRDMVCLYNFLWLITGTPTGIFYSGDNTYIKKLFNSNHNFESINDCFVFKNDDKFIEQSIVLPNPKRLKIKCVTPKELNIIKDIIPPSVLQMINAGNSEQAIRSLNCNVDTNENILQVVTKNILDSIRNKQIELEAETKKIYPPGLQGQKEHESKIKFIENQITKLQEKYNDIKKKIYDLNDSHCPVCMGEFTNPIFTECCKSCFCFDCLAVSLGELKTNKCPNCRQTISHSSIHVIADKNSSLSTKSDLKTDKYELKDKLDVLVDLIENKPDGSFMVFANYAETFVKIEQKLKELKITYHILKGVASVVAKNIEDFKEKRVRVLMLNAEFFGAGMNLQMTTDLVMFHRFKQEMEEQIIGRAQRLGRTTPLNVYYLLHDNESDEIVNNFKFDDQGSVHYMDWLENNKNENNIVNNVNNIVNNIDNNNEIFTIKMINSDEEEFYRNEINSNEINSNEINSNEIKIDNAIKSKSTKTKIKSDIDNEEYLVYKEEKLDIEDPEEFINTVSKNIFLKSNVKSSNKDVDIDIDININFDEFEIIS
jgi:hypothetical protein